MTKLVLHNLVEEEGKQDGDGLGQMVGEQQMKGRVVFSISMGDSVFSKKKKKNVFQNRKMRNKPK